MLLAEVAFLESLQDSSPGSACGRPTLAWLGQESEPTLGMRATPRAEEGRTQLPKGVPEVATRDTWLPLEVLQTDCGLTTDPAVPRPAVAASGMALVEKADFGATPWCPAIPFLVASIGRSIIDPIAAIVDPSADPCQELAKHGNKPKPIIIGLNNRRRRGVQPSPPLCQVVSSKVAVPLPLLKSTLLDQLA